MCAIDFVTLMVTSSGTVVGYDRAKRARAGGRAGERASGGAKTGAVSGCGAVDRKVAEIPYLR